MKIIETLNNLFEKKSLEEVLSFIIEKFDKKIVFTTSLGAEDQVVTEMLSDKKNNLSIATLDTGRLFPETYDLIQRTEARYKLKIKTYFPSHSKVEKMVNKHGINLFYESVENRKLCCYIRKIESLKRALKNNEIWITGLRREQSVTRTTMQFAEFDKENNIIKINPLINWTNEDVWKQIKEKKIPYNLLHDKGFPSIGCFPCTRAIEKGEDIRAGRWWWENPDTKECGLHKK